MHWLMRGSLLLVSSLAKHLNVGSNPTSKIKSFLEYPEAYWKHLCIIIMYIHTYMKAFMWNLKTNDFCIIKINHHATTDHFMHSVNVELKKYFSSIKAIIQNFTLLWEKDNAANTAERIMYFFPHSKDIFPLNSRVTLEEFQPQTMMCTLTDFYWNNSLNYVFSISLLPPELQPLLTSIKYNDCYSLHSNYLHMPIPPTSFHSSTLLFTILYLPDFPRLIHILEGQNSDLCH